MICVAAALLLSFGCLVTTEQARPPKLAELRARARADSNDPVAHYNVAAALANDGRYADAERSVREAVQIDPQYAPALLLLSAVLSREQARRARGMVFVVFTRGRIVFLRPEPSGGEAARLRRRAFLIDPLLELGPPSREWLPVVWRGTLDRALRAYEREEWPEAIAGFQTVIDRTVRPTDSMAVPPVALWFRARCAMRVGDYDTAIRHLQWLLALRMPDSTHRELTWNPFGAEELEYVLAYVYQQAGRWDDAIRLYQGVLEQNLGWDPVHSHLAEIYEAQERWPDAIQERRRAIDANPEEPALLFDLGSTLAYGGLYSEAEGVLLKYAEAHPRESRLYYLLGFVRMRLGRPGPARDALTQYLALAPSRYVEQIADAKRRLAALAP